MNWKGLNCSLSLLMRAYFAFSVQTVGQIPGGILLKKYNFAFFLNEMGVIGLARIKIQQGKGAVYEFHLKARAPTPTPNTVKIDKERISGPN